MLVYRLFGARCAKCRETFSKNDYVMRARHKIYHIRCFHCVACKVMLQPGDEFALRDDRLYCKSDHVALEQVASFSLDTGTATGATLEFGQFPSRLASPRVRARCEQRFSQGHARPSVSFQCSQR